MATKIKNLIRKIIRKFPSWQQWQNLPKVLNKKELYFILLLILLTIASTITWIITSNIRNTKLIPDHGGSFKEGIVGNPQYINPVLSQSNDADRDLAELIFSGLMKYNEQGELTTDIAEDYAIGEQGKVYDFFLRKDIKWHDNTPLTADDVIFTIQAIQNPANRSPLRINWTGVEIQKIDDYTVRFILSTPYAPFLANTTIGILPRHIWENIPPESFLLAPHNLEPIGTGPYKFKSIDQDDEGFVESIKLESYENYHLSEPYIEEIEVFFYPDEESLIRAYNRGRVDNISLYSPKNKTLITRNESNILRLNMPRYFAIFFNQSQSKPLADETVRLALNYATNKQEIIDETLEGEAKPVYSPIPKGVWAHTDEIDIYDYAPEHAKNILEEDGWTDEDNDGIREKGETKLEIELTTTELKELQQTASIIQKQWEEIGAKVNLKILNIGEIQQEYIRPREYQALLFGQVLGIDPDPFSFWHSSQKKDPGLNLALYDNQTVDTLLEEARQTLDKQERIEDYKEIQQTIVEDAPAVFLYSSYHLYINDQKIKGADVENIVLPSKRFSNINDWYIKTKRIKK
ncbi:MAG: hypothetical protein GF387_01680 [Candidatus Portnoybacteria bacterium]|nr:hypothetical protein [Candidatus Portnoybacteria bacterium]